MGFEADHYAGDIALYAGSMVNPSDFQPSFHVNYGSKLAWLDLEDAHERYDTTLAHSGKDVSGCE